MHMPRLAGRTFMDFDRAARRLDGVPMTPPRLGRRLYDFVLAHQPQRILELGFAHGVSTCYMAAALDELGRGEVVTMDKRKARKLDPSIHDLLGELGLADYVQPVFADRSFTWELMKLLERQPEPSFDFVFHDGGHSWDVAGFGFFLADRLLRPGGWMLFDDLKWTIGHSPSLADREWAQTIPAEERDTAQVGKVFDLLVEPHPDYTDVRRDRRGHWGWARKRVPDAPDKDG